MNSGIVIQSTGKWYIVSDGDREIDCRLPGIFRLNSKEVTNPVAAGDHVDYTLEEDGKGTIRKIHERRNHIPRQATHGRRGEQILISNIDKAWVVQSVKSPKLNMGFIDRFLVTCEAYEVPAGIIINKMDLANEKAREVMQDISGLYQGLGYDVVLTSVNQIESANKLRKLFSGSISVMIGPSGVGKSSLINAIDPSLNLRVGEISSHSDKGKHTTTFARLIALEQGGFIADTPGIREFGLVKIQKSELSLYFPEMEETRQLCKYYNCTHYHEPGCAVHEAFKKGSVDADRYHSYLNILDSLPE
ncbi:MAG: ribosome small subunit-dependent GTPase A [Balneolaceae bacterium]|nr:MAG: ribosome small subunit-dependent GTPase A [Balneolaceae bacterium]